MNISKVQPIGKSKALLLSDTDGNVYGLDITPFIVGDWFAELNEDSYFAQVAVDPSGLFVAWPNGQDIAPDDIDYLAVKAGSLSGAA